MLGNIKDFDIKRPESVVFSLIEGDKNKAVFSVSPYERGFSVTMGNTLRRLLLSSVEGYAIVAVYFDCINNEFESIGGVIEETAEIILNLKRVNIALADETLKSRTLRFEIKGKKKFFAKDLQVDSEVVIGNPDLLIFESTADAGFSFEIQINKGWGYRPSEEIEPFLDKKGAIALDASFSPVSLVSYETRPVSIEGVRNYEELLLTVHTRGAMSPQVAIQKAVSLLKECIWSYEEFKEHSVMKAVSIQEKEDAKNDEIYNKSIFYGNFSMRTCFFLKSNDILEMGQLVLRTEKELTDKPHFNEFILEDIKVNLERMGLKLGMKDIAYVDMNV